MNIDTLDIGYNQYYGDPGVNNGEPRFYHKNNGSFDFEGWLAYSDDSNSIIDDPVFVQNLSPGNDGKWGTPDDEGDLHLQPGSPCIDQGTNSIADMPETDFEGDLRIMDGDKNGEAIVDMGADEYIAASCDNDTGCDESVAITLASFNVKAGNHSVKIIWETGDETDNLGFNIYRAESTEGAYVKINKSLIYSKVGTGLGATYEFIDENVKNRTSYFYKLEDVDIYGLSNTHGPVSATPRLVYGIVK